MDCRNPETSDASLFNQLKIVYEVLAEFWCERRRVCWSDFGGGVTLLAALALIARRACLSSSSCPPLCPHASTRPPNLLPTPTGRIFVKIDVGDFLRKSVVELRIWGGVEVGRQQWAL